MEPFSEVVVPDLAQDDNFFYRVQDFPAEIPQPAEQEI